MNTAKYLALKAVHDEIGKLLLLDELPDSLSRGLLKLNDLSSRAEHLRTLNTIHEQSTDLLALNWLPIRARLKLAKLEQMAAKLEDDLENGALNAIRTEALRLSLLQGVPHHVEERLGLIESIARYKIDVRSEADKNT